MKDKMKDLNLEGGSVILSTSQSFENLKMIDDSIKGLSKVDANKLKKNLEEDLKRADQGYLQYIEDVLEDSS